MCLSYVVAPTSSHSVSQVPDYTAELTPIALLFVLFESIAIIVRNHRAFNAADTMTSLTSIGLRTVGSLITKGFVLTLYCWLYDQVCVPAVGRPLVNCSCRCASHLVGAHMLRFTLSICLGTVCGAGFLPLSRRTLPTIFFIALHMKSTSCGRSVLCCG